MNWPCDVRSSGPLAPTRNDPEMVALLLWFGADPLHFDSGSRTAYDCATTEAVEGDRDLEMGHGVDAVSPVTKDDW
jgi:hypothetical protein